MPGPTQLSESSLRKMEVLKKSNEERIEQQRLIVERVRQLQKDQQDYLDALPDFIASRVRVNMDEVVAEAVENVSRFVEQIQSNEEKKRLSQKLRELKQEEARALERRQAVAAERQRVAELKEQLGLATQEYVELLQLDRTKVQEQIRLYEAVKKAQSTGC
ncbi:unnamed protein product [Bursaphelenchus xylophilus]|uniref:(pine wood nematode) hypothetical protein n=1 Tax=Bursaphelenchus xylophilus TaxID=6326 RepID=A0A1I7RQT9_BURXY|nr:unnamed protein product [Bursaphelenchus xylophilus]CAG9113269.1 unnamed protein product [Bursaphelenchus xylophilus]